MAAGNVLFKLLGQVFVDTDEADKSMSKTTKSAENMAEKIGKGAKAVGTIGAAAVGAGVAVTGALVNQAKSAAGVADEIDKASIRMGISAEKYQELQYVAEQSGVAMGVMEKAAKKLEGSGMNIDEAMSKIMSYSTAEERAAAASELLGDAIAYQMSPMIEQSGEDFNGLIDRANELGLVMSGDSVKAGVEFGDLMADLQKSVKMLGTGLGSTLLPILVQIIQQVIAFMPQIQALMKDIAPIAEQFIKDVLPPLLELAKEVLPILIQLISAIAPALSEIAGSILPVFTEILKEVLPPILQLTELVLPVLLDIINALTPVIELLGMLVGGVLKSAFESIMPYIENVMKAFNGLIDFITGVFAGNWEKAWQGIVDMFGGIFGSIFELFKIPLNAIINGINVVLDTIGTIQIPDWVPVLGGKTFSIPQLPMLANGGTITSSGSVIVGEKGPEMLSLPAGAKVTPLSAGASDYVLEAIKQSTSEIVNAIRTYNAGTIKVDDPYKIFKLVKNEEAKYNLVTGRA